MERGECCALADALPDLTLTHASTNLPLMQSFIDWHDTKHHAIDMDRIPRIAGTAPMLAIWHDAIYMDGM